MSFILLTTHINSACAQAADSIKTTTLKVKGVTCAADLKTISANVEKLPGVVRCFAKKPGASTIFQILFDPEKVTEKDIVAAIEDSEGCEDPKDRPYKVKQ
jgi:copper chaperone CopZ